MALTARRVPGRSFSMSSRTEYSCSAMPISFSICFTHPFVKPARRLLFLFVFYQNHRCDHSHRREEGTQADAHNGDGG